MALWPYLKGAFHEFAYPVSFPASVLFFSLLSWYCGLLHLPLFIALVPFAVLFIRAAWKGEYSRKAFVGQGVWVFLFLLFFFAMVSVRFVNPSISYAEKFMDHAFLASIMRVPVVPPLDPWFLGGYLNVYYYFGYWMIGALGTVSGVPSYITFNLALPTVLGLSAMMMYALGRLLTRRFAYLTLATFIVANPSFFWQVIQGKSLGSVFWDSTRTIPDTINEYPLFSFLWGDVHPHVIGIFNQVLYLFILVYAWTRWRSLRARERLSVILIAALSLGAMPLINTWDVIVYAPVTVLVGLMIWYQGGTPSPPPGAGNLEIIRSAIKRATAGVSGLLGRRVGERGREDADALQKVSGHPCAFILMVPGISVLLYLPFYFQMNTRGIQGVGIVHTPTGPVDFLLVHGLFLVLMVLYLYKDIWKRPLLLLIPLVAWLSGHGAAALAAIPLVYLLCRRTRSPAEVLAIIGLSIVIMCEAFFLVDNMGETYYRMNTIFKFYISAWLLMGASSFAMLSEMLDRRFDAIRSPAWLKRAALIAVAILMLVTPLVLPLDSPYRGATLDGLDYVNSAYPGDAEAVAFLRELPGVQGIVEAIGGDYTYYSRVSSFTGVPAVLGWSFHEFMWRDDTDGWYGRRIEDVRTMYEQPDRTAALMRVYNATHIYVGDLEREQYAVRVDEAGLLPVYDRAGVRIYALPG